MKTIEILIVTRSVVLQQGLGALLESLPEVAAVKAVKELSSMYAWIEAHQPKVVLLDEDLLGRNPEAALDRIRTLSPKTQRAILVNGVLGVRLLPDHAEAILIKGAPPSAINSTITNLLSAKGEDHEPHHDSN